MQASSLYLSQKSLRVKQHGNILTRSSSREISMINLSFEDYHGGASVAVPFNWESEPGTPKVKSPEIPSLPPLTPPPSYFYSTPKRPVKKNQSRPNLLDSIFSKRSRRKTSVKLSPASSSTSSASSSRSSSPWPRPYSVPSSPMTASNLYARNELSRARLFCDSRADDEEEHEYQSSVSTPCFGRGASTRSRGICSSMLRIWDGQFRNSFRGCVTVSLMMGHGTELSALFILLYTRSNLSLFDQYRGN
ncbi:PREDICTED: uncharacterized protein LOC18591069 [Theobroma cacao]|uniref:Uncharacterized protein LOC18591069 n=1 Tax=Theobroma cacao TaxID=3641 RepID=A0AB32UTQ4_THECC|nr:PREDICTED: uncharacterized protein LOC18591069 [Theobroma cacao]